MILASAEENSPVEEQAELADRIMDVTTTVAPVTQAQSSTNPFLPTPDINAFCTTSSNPAASATNPDPHRPVTSLH